MERFRQRLQHLKHPINSVLDVGAYRGDIAKSVLNKYKKTKQVNFYTLPEDQCTTGSSVYRENTVYYQDPIVIKKWAYALDDLNLPRFDLIKLDVQGSELDILKGGKKYLAATQPTYLLLETSIQEYNQDAPLAGEVISYLNKNRYRLCDIFDVLYDKSNQLLQVDFLFERYADTTKRRY